MAILRFQVKKRICQDHRRKRIEIPIVYRRLLLEKNRLAGAWDILDLNGGRERWRRRDRSNGVCSDIKGAKG